MNRKKSIITLASIIGLAVIGSVYISMHKDINLPFLPDNTNKQITVTDQFKDPAKWVLAFADDFDGTALDTTKWSTCYEWYEANNAGCTNSGNNELEWYLKEQVKLADGQLILTSEDKPVPTSKNGVAKEYPYRSGMVSSGRPDYNNGVKWEGKYGYYEARIKVQGGRGVWPAFWLLPTDKQWPPEIDIMELVGHKPNEILMTHHWSDKDGLHVQDSSTATGADFTKDWHVYSVNWQPGRIDWYIDGELKKSATNNVPDEPMQIILNQAVGGNLPGSPDAGTVFPSVMAVDYVRAYGLKR